MGGGAFLLRWLGTWPALVLAALAVAFNAGALHRLTGGRLLRAGEVGASAGVTLYPAAVGALLLAFHGRLELAAAAWGILAFGDGAAGLAGRSLGGPALPWNPGKRWSGLVAFVLVAAPMGALLVRWTQAGHGADLFRGAPGEEALWLAGACLVAALAAALAESLDSAIDDNVRVPAAAGLVLAAASAVAPGGWAGLAASAAAAPVLIGAGMLAVPTAVALAVGAVRPSGAAVGWGLVSLLLAALGWGAVVTFAAFFVVATGATWLGHARKTALGVAHERGGRRGATHALANAGAGVALALLAAASSGSPTFALASAAAFATAAFDTVASEIGQVWGRRHVLPTTLRGVPPGTEGAVSLEGTFAGAVAAAVVGVVAAAAGVTPWDSVFAVVAGAAAGALLESVAGAALTRQRRADNGLLNLGATLVGAGVAVALRVLAG